MGQIVIDIPSKKTRRYILDDAKQAEVLLDELDRSAIRVKQNAEPAADPEDAADLVLVRKAVAEFRRTGKSRPWKEVKAELGL